MPSKLVARCLIYADNSAPFRYDIVHTSHQRLCLRESSKPKRETKLNGILLFVHTSVWKALFGKQADVLEKDDEHENTYMYGRDGVVVVVLGVEMEFLPYFLCGSTCGVGMYVPAAC